MELTESRVEHKFNTRVLALLSSCSGRWQHVILFTEVPCQGTRCLLESLTCAL